MFEFPELGCEKNDIQSPVRNCKKSDLALGGRVASGRLAAGCLASQPASPPRLAGRVGSESHACRIGGILLSDRSRIPVESESYPCRVQVISLTDPSHIPVRSETKSRLFQEQVSNFVFRVSESIWGAHNKFFSLNSSVSYLLSAAHTGFA